MLNALRIYQSNFEKIAKSVFLLIVRHPLGEPNNVNNDSNVPLKITLFQTGKFSNSTITLFYNKRISIFLYAAYNLYIPYFCIKEYLKFFFSSKQNNF